MSALGVGVALFLFYGALYVLIGTLTPLFTDPEREAQMLFVSPRADAVLFGGRPSELLRADPQLAQLRSILLRVIAGLLLTSGVLILGVTWFALRERQAWALVVLGLAGIAVLPLWALAFRPYVSASAPLGLGDLPPFMWVPSVLLVPAIAASWIGLRQ